MKTIEEVKNYLLKNRVDKDGNLDLSGLDFSDFNGDIYIDNIKVKKRLYQNSQEVRESLYQNDQKVEGNLYQSRQIVQGDFITQTLNDDECYEIDKYGRTCIFKKPKINL